MKRRAAGTILTCTRCGAKGDLKNAHSTSGWIVIPRTQAACATCVREVIEKKEAAEKIRKAALERLIVTMTLAGEIPE